jgi:tetratricopeptide (TPR) repeat protein
MTTPGVVLLLGTLVTQSPANDSLREHATHLPAAALAAEAQARPLAVREAITEALAATVETSADDEHELTVARRLAEAYATAWRDSFLVRVVARFAAWPPERRARKVWADSVRRAGVAAYGRDGPRAAIAMWRRALARATSIADTVGVAAVLGNIGAGLLAESRVDSAEDYLTRSRALAHTVGDLRVEANALTALATLSKERGDFAAAREHYGQAAGLSERIGDSRGVAADHNNLGLLAQTVGDTLEASRQFEAALALNRRDGRDAVAATNLVNLAGLASEAGDFPRAETLYRDALATWREREQWANLASALRGLGLLELRRGDYPAARANLFEALSIYRRTGPVPD